MTELDELKQRLEIEELRGRLSAAEKQISILTDTLATLTEIQTSDRLGSYINSQVRLLKAAEFLNSVSDGEKIAPQLQRQSVEQAGLRKAELDEHISRTVQLSKEKSLHTVDSRIANAVDNWQSSTSAQDPKLFTYRNEGGGITITGLVLRRDFGGEAIQPIPSFSGAFNGNGHSITNFTLATDGSHQGFFRYIEEGARVINLKLSGTITPDGTRENVGGLAGTNRGTITGCAFDGTVSGLTNVGGVAGENYGTVKNCTVTGKVTGKRYTGGVVGFNNGTIDSAYNHAEVNTSITASELELDSLSLMDMTSLDLTSANDANVVSDSGGIVGGSVGLIYNSVNYGTIGYQHYGYNVGGVAGRQSGYMEGCENHGRVYGRKDVGGIVGQMEPYMELALSEDLATELQTLHDLVTVTLSDTNIQNDDVNAALSRMQSNAYSAAQGASNLADHLGGVADTAIDSTNEILNRIDYSIKAMEPIMSDLNQAAVNFSLGMQHMDNAMDNLEMDSATLGELHTNLDQMSEALERINVELEYLSYIASAYFNKKGDGEVDLDQLRPDNSDEIKDKYGYDYDLDAGSSSAKLKKALVQVVSDLIMDTAKLSKATSKVLAILDDYYLTPIYDTDGDGIPDQSRLEYANDEGGMARDNFNAASNYLASATGGLDELNQYLASLDKVQFPNLGSKYYDYSDELFNGLTGVAGSMSDLNVAMDSTSDTLTLNLMRVNDQFNVVMQLLANALSGNIENNVYDDVSEPDNDESIEGKLSGCVNYGEVSGDLDIGGIAGAMAIEFEADVEGDVTSGLSVTRILSKTYMIKCVARRCVNRGAVTAKKNNVGGIAGVTEMGTIIDCEGYGSVESSTGGYVGGIVGYSYTNVRDSYAMCNIAGSEYVGGIAGYGTEITDCHSLVGVTGATACGGAIAGYADMNGEGVVDGNSFVHETLGAIDGISYNGRATPISYEQLLAVPGIPDEFRTLTLRFVADGETVKELSFSYGDSIDESEIPAVPEKDGYSGHWADYDYSALYFSDVIEAEYSYKRATLAVENTRAGSPMSIVLVEGSFNDGSQAMLNEYVGDDPHTDGTVLEKWVLRIDDMDEDTAAGSYSVRFLRPELEHRSHKLEIYTFDGTDWTRVSTRSSGSYTVFDCNSDTVVFAAVETRGTPVWVWVGVGVLAAAAVGAFAVLRRRKSKAKDEETA